MPPILIDGRQLGERIGYPYRTVMGWYRDGLIPGIRTGRGRVLFDLDKVLTALRERGRRREEVTPCA